MNYKIISQTETMSFDEIGFARFDPNEGDFVQIIPQKPGISIKGVQPEKTIADSLFIIFPQYLIYLRKTPI
ncbi:MAG: hypothetical protein PHV30_10240 [Candidatus Margulisbacteria bacterium]|nr:hypothetical protein [Candidatus Margulisiibacteriota bacterium]